MASEEKMQQGKAVSENSKDYLQRHHVMTYLEDSMMQLLRKKDEDRKTKPFHFLADYFKRVVSGNHVALREYSFITATPYNQRCFIKLFWDSYQNIAETRQAMTCLEYYSLLRLLCHNFPQELIHTVSMVIFLDASLDNFVSFSDFAYAFQVCFYYKDFLQKCSEECYSINSSLSLRAKSSPIIIPTSKSLLKETISYHYLDNTDKDDTLHENIDPKLFWLSIQYLLIDKDHTSTLLVPNSRAVEEAIFCQNKISYYNFVNTLVRNDIVSEEIGVLPSRNTPLKK